MLKVGIVGLPNVGKSTLFNALLKKQVADAANYPFCTIEPNVGVIEVPDERLAILAEIVATKTILPAAVEFYDIAGLVRGAAEGEGLGNKFLSHIRETALICHVLRLFEDPNITHVDDQPDALRDVQTIETELVLADLSILANQKEPRGNATKEEMFRWETVQKVRKHLDAGLSARLLTLDDDEKEAIKMFNIITLKPILYVFNVSEDQLLNKPVTESLISELFQKASITSDQQENPEYIILSAKLEQDLATLSEDEQALYLSEYNLTEPCLQRLITHAYARLNLISFLTAGVKEVRAWPIPKGTRAPQAAATIHTDFEKHFIKAEVVKFADFVSAKGWSGAREAGKAQLGGKDYVMQDGDVVEFKVGV